MFPSESDVNIAKNIKVIEWLKADFLASTAALFKAMIKGSEEAILDALASILVFCYIIGRRLGLGFSRLDLKVQVKLKEIIEQGHQVETWYGDISALTKYLTDKKR